MHRHLVIRTLLFIVLGLSIGVAVQDRTQPLDPQSLIGE
jgi:hypothetical protein